MANIKSIGGNPIVLDASGIAPGAVTPDKLADMGGITAGAALGITGNTTDSAAWLQRVSTADGPTTIRSIHGNTIVQDGALVPVNMTGIESTGFNQWDEQWENGYISDTTGENVGASTSYLRAKNHIPCFASTEYHWRGDNSGKVMYYDADKGYLSYEGISGSGTTFTTPSNAAYMRFWCNYSGDYKHDICINLSDPTRNGEYEPYWQQQRIIPASTYFPQGMRSAGSVHDELRADAAVTRVGAVDLGTLTWEVTATGDTGQYRMVSSGIKALIAKPASSATLGDMKCSKYETMTSTQVYQLVTGISVAYDGDLAVYDPNYAASDSATAFKAAMSGVMLHYALATPTTTPIDPPLNMTYRTEQGGTERVIVPTGENSAPPTIVAASGYTAESLSDTALSAIAPVENGLASTNYGVGSYLVHGGQLCKVTTAIATGESITIGTNVVTTTVMAEVIALIAQ